MNQNEKESPKIPGEQEYERAIYLINSGYLKEAIPLFYKSANLNYPPSFLWLSFLAMDRNESQNWELKAEKNFTWYQSKAQDGKPDSLYNLAYCFHFEIGTEEDLNKSIELFHKAAEQGFAMAQCYLGVCYECGQGVPEDMIKAIAFYRKAAIQGDAAALCSLGNCYRKGRGVPKNTKKAIELYNKAAEQGHAGAQNSLGECYTKGIYKDLQRAAEWFSKAAEQGLARALHNLGLCYQYGDGVVKDIKRTIELFSKAAKQGYGEAEELNLYNQNVDLQDLADVLKVNDTLTMLNLNDNNIGDAEAKVIADILKVNNTLTELYLIVNDIGALGAKSIADALKSNNTLSYLGLDGNEIGDLGAEAIADALKLEKSTVKDTSIESIEQALKLNRVFLGLKISSRALSCFLFNLKVNGIGDKGIDAIAEMLKVNNSLQTLEITNNIFTDACKLGEALKYNRSLIELRIDEEPTVKELKKALQFNICLLKIEQNYGDLFGQYSEDSFGPFQSDTIKGLLERNENIQTKLSKRIFECKNAYLSLLDYKILGRINVAVIFNNVWEIHQTQQTGKTYEEYLREYWELISLGFSKYFLFILGICKLNQIPPSRSHLLGIPKEILTHIGSFLNPKDFPIDINETCKVLKTENQKLKEQLEKQSMQSQTEIQELKKQLAAYEQKLANESKSQDGQRKRKRKK